MKIKIANIYKGRNATTFRTFLQHHLLFGRLGVEFVEEGKFDMEFIGMEDFIDRKVSLKDSISWGLEALSKKTESYCLFDGSDSTSLMGAVEVFAESKALFLLKPALTTREQYAEPSSFGKWFFGCNVDCGLNLRYTLSEDLFSRIKRTGWNLGHYHPQYLQKVPILPKTHDVCALFKWDLQETKDHLISNSQLYCDHRVKAMHTILNMKDTTVYSGTLPPAEFYPAIGSSRCTVSPFGMGEICFRDFEAIMMGSVLIKPDMFLVNTYPNIYIPYETYIPCKLDWSDLEEKIQWVKDHPADCIQIISRARELMRSMYYGVQYEQENLMEYWWDLLQEMK